jgi:hypothetical protein
MANKKLQMKEYNTSSAEWDSLLPVTGIEYVTGISSSIRDFLGTPSSANLRAAVTDETGTGALVFAQSATLTYSNINFATITASTVSNSTFIAPSLGTATANSINAVSLSASTSGFTVRNNTASIVRTGTGSLTFVGSTASYTLNNGGFLLASDAAPSANEGKVLQVVGGTPSWVSAGSISGSVAITGSLDISSNLVVKGTTTLTTSLNGVVLASSGAITAGSASLTNQVSGTLPVGRGGSGATTLTGVLLGNGTSPFTTVTAPSGTIVGTSDTQTLTNKTLIDGTTTFADGSDNTKTMKLQLGSISPGVEVDLTVPNLSGVLAVTSGAQILTDKTLSTGTVSSGVVVQKSPVITLGGDLTGNVTLTNLGNGTLTALIAANSVALGTDTTGSYVESLVAGSAITLSGNSGEGSTPTINNNGVTSLVAGTNMAVSTGTGAVTISTIANPTFSGTVNIGTLNLTNALTEAEGGTGESTYSSGQILIGNSSNGLTKAFISGTTNEINVTTASGAITIGLPNIVSVTGLNASGRITASSLNVSGSAILGTIVGPTGFSDGDAGNPGINFSSDTDTGIYRIGTNDMGFAALGALRASVNVTGFNVDGSSNLTLNSNIYGLNVTGAPYANPRILRIAGTGGVGTPYTVGTDGSSRRIKEEIQNLQFDTENFLKLQPKTYKFKTDIQYNGAAAKPTIGFIAEEAKELGLVHLYQEDSEGIPDYFAYDKLPIYLMSIVKQQQEQIKSLTARIEALEGN